MKHITANTAGQDFDRLLENVIEYGEAVSIATDKGSAILVSEDEWSGLHETLYLMSIPGVYESIIEGSKTPVSECIPLSEVWDDV
jgi:PHD/YefM family antitoxin component YafN of YafNO toxin-antitoxin module